MSRVPRKASESGYYHIVLKRAGGRLLFESGSDFRAFIALLRKHSLETGVVTLAYCLMSNHVHVLLRDADQMLVTLMRKLGTTFAMRYNDTTGHTGPVFHNRYWSVPIDTDEQLLETARYILQNPVKEELGAIDTYEWSSHAAYMGAPSFVDTSVLLEMLGGVEGFAEFMALPNTAYDPMPSGGPTLTDEAAMKILDDVLGEDGARSLGGASRAARNEALRKLRDAGIGATQASRLTGIGRSTISRVFATG